MDSRRHRAYQSRSVLRTPDHDPRTGSSPRCWFRSRLPGRLSRLVACRASARQLSWAGSDQQCLSRFIPRAFHLMQAISVPAVAIVTVAMTNALGGGLFRLPSSGWGLVPAIALYALAMDFGEYVFHRAQHRFPVLGRCIRFIIATAPSMSQPHSATSGPSRPSSPQRSISRSGCCSGERPDSGHLRCRSGISSLT